jgi:hypothetical protein
MIRETFTVFIGLGALLYLIFPSLVPDFLPFIGWIDEGMATTVLLSVFAYYGIDLTHLLGRSDTAEAIETSQADPQHTGEKRKRYALVPKSRLAQGQLTREELEQYQIVELDEQAARAARPR